MGLYTGESNWVNQIYQFEQTDPVQGGDEGIDNRPLKELADRTTWLKNDIGKIQRVSSSYYFFNTNGTITPDMAGRFIGIRATSIITITLPNAASIPYGSLLFLSSYCSTDGAINIATQGGQVIEDLLFSSGSETMMHMHHRENLTLVAFINHWKVVSATGNFYTAGEELKGRKVLLNTLPLEGQLLDCARYPRLWKYIQKLGILPTGSPNGHEVVTDEMWNDDISYRGCFAVGDDPSKFRLPNEKGMFERMLDPADSDRVHKYAGGYQADQFREHSHNMKGSFSQGGYDGGSNDFYRARSSNAFGSGAGIIAVNGGLETRPKNIAKINLIRF